MACNCQGVGGLKFIHSANCISNLSRSGEMADTPDLKSGEIKSHPGSSPGTGTTFYKLREGWNPNAAGAYEPYVDDTRPKQDKDFRIIELSRRRKILKDYLQEKVDEEDFHGVQDVASDLRDLDSELKGLRFK